MQEVERKMGIESSRMAGHKGPFPMTGDLPRCEHRFFVSETIVFNI